MSWHDFALIAPLLSARIEMLLIVWRIEVGRSGSPVSQDIGNKLTRLSILSHSSFRPEWSRPAGWQPIYLGEDENVTEVPVETIPEDILKCDEVHWGKTTLFFFKAHTFSQVWLSIRQRATLSPKNYISLNLWCLVF